MPPSSTPPVPGDYAPFYQKYIERVPPGDVIATLEAQLGQTIALAESMGELGAGHRYAPGKWSIRQLIGHVTDNERIMSYRALRIARGDETPLAGYDEGTYAEASGADERTLADLVAELRAVRAATVALLRGLPKEAWARRGTANNVPVTVNALAYIMAGHELHHREVLQTRYLR